MKPRYLLQAIARPTEDEQCVSGRSKEKLRKMKVAMMRLLLKNGVDPLAAYPDNSNVLQNIIEEHGELEPLWEIADLSLETRGRGWRTPPVSPCFPRVPAHERIIPGGEPASKAIAMPPRSYSLQKEQMFAVDDMRRSALHWLCTMPEELDDAHKSVFTTLVTQAPGLVDLGNRNYILPLQLAFKNYQSWAADTLISLGANLSEADANGNTALHFRAARLSRERERAAIAAERFKHFLTLGIPVESRNKDGETPLFVFISTVNLRACPYEGNEEDISLRKAFQIFQEAGADMLRYSCHPSRI
jgi:ankyrin repeat protein